MMFSREESGQLTRQWAEKALQGEVEHPRDPDADGRKEVDPGSPEFARAVAEVFKPIVDDIPTSPQGDYVRSWPWRPAKVDYAHTNKAGWVAADLSNRRSS